MRRAPRGGGARRLGVSGRGRGRCRTGRRTGAFGRRAAAALPLAGFAGAAGQVGTVRLCLCASGMHQRAFLPAGRAAPAARHDQQQKLREFHDAKYTRAGASRLRPELLSTRFQSNALVKAEVFMRISKTLGAVLAIAACGVSTAMAAYRRDNPLGFYVGAGVGESRSAAMTPATGIPATTTITKSPGKGSSVSGRSPMLGVEAEYIDFGQPYRHHQPLRSSTYSGSDSHPTAPVLFARGLPADCRCRSSISSPRPAWRACDRRH